MIPIISTQRKLVEDLRWQLALEEQRLKELLDRCEHAWGPTFPDHEYVPGYEIPGDPPGTMGVDRRGPFYVEAHTKKKWKRICKKCGEVQVTKKVTTVTETIETPTFD